MTGEEKQLLLKDLHAKAMYGLKVMVVDNGSVLTLFDILGNDKVYLKADEKAIRGWSVDIENVKPFLRPFHTMTDEEREEYKKTFYNFGNKFGIGLSYPSYESFDWLDKHFFDYRGLIENGLAIEAIEGLYN